MPRELSTERSDRPMKPPTRAALAACALLTASLLVLTTGCASKMNGSIASAECVKGGFDFGSDEWKKCVTGKLPPGDPNNPSPLRRHLALTKVWQAQCEATFGPLVGRTRDEYDRVLRAIDGCVFEKMETHRLLEEAASSRSVHVPVPSPSTPRQPICLVMKDGICQQFGTTQ